MCAVSALEPVSLGFETVEVPAGHDLIVTHRDGLGGPGVQWWRREPGTSRFLCDVEAFAGLPDPEERFVEVA